MLKTDASLSIRRVTTKSWKILLCTFGLIIAWQALRGVAWHEVWHLLGKIDFRVIVFLTALNLLMLPLMNARWWLFLRMLDNRVGLLSLCAYRTAANTVSYLTPGPHFGGEPLSVYLLVQRHLISASAATASVAVDRLLELLASFGVLAFSVACLAFTEADPFKGTYHLLPIVAVFLLCLVVLGSVVTGRKPFSQAFRMLVGLIHKPFPRVSRRIGQLADGVACTESIIQLLYQRQRYQFLLANFFSLVYWGAVFAEFWLISAFLGVQLLSWQLVGITIVARLAFFSPMPAGIGVLELALPWATASFGLGGALGVSLCLIIRLRDVIFSLFGSGLLLNYLTCHKKVPIIKDI